MLLLWLYKLLYFDVFPLFPVLTHDEKRTKTFGYQIGLLDCVDCVGAVTFSFEIIPVAIRVKQ